MSNSNFDDTRPISGVGYKRVLNIAKYYFATQHTRPELRGGTRHQLETQAKMDCIVKHITSFKCRASHYGRRGTPGRKYLPVDLSVARMHELYCQDENNIPVKYHYYYAIFVTKFNLSFGSPATDVCSKCVQLKVRITSDIPTAEKRTAAAELILHRRRAYAFYQQMNQIVENELTLCFDMMKNLVLPKTAIGQAYYSRQLYQYVFCIVEHNGKGSDQMKEKVIIYTWLESENKKDSNLIASALTHALTSPQSPLLEQLEHCNKLRLFSDSCAGQNKNVTVLAMLFNLRRKLYPRLEIQFTFPIRGHSFLPADRVFGRIEKDIRKKDVILHPEEYTTIMNKHATVMVYGKDWRAYDHKKESAKLVKDNRGDFKISEARVLEIRGDRITSKASFAGDGTEYAVLKRGKSWLDYDPQLLPDQSNVKEKKKIDVRKLLAELHVDQDTLNFYTSQLDDGIVATATPVADGDGVNEEIDDDGESDNSTGDEA